MSMIKKIKLIKSNVVKRNLKALLSRDLKIELFNIRNELVYLKLLRYYEDNPNKEFEKEISYLKELGFISGFPYKQVKRLKDVECRFDVKRKMPFVMHNNKRLYFPKPWDIEQAKGAYANLIQNENILGGGYTEKAPHQYQTDDFRVNEGDVVLEIGAAEALFSLDIIDLVKKIYIFEPKKIWLKPLQATFEPYKDKVEIITKFVSNKDTYNEVKLETCLKLDEFKSVFMKMDIEGFEKLVIEDNISFFSKNTDIRVSCCTYHKQTDAEDFKKIFSGMGYITEYSDGYMLFLGGDDLRPPYFRKGMIRASRIFK
jgi:hypothetical protein